MGICGLRTWERQKLVSRKRIWLDPKRRWLLLCIVWLVLAIFPGGCATTIKYGLPPKVKELSTLTPGISTKSDVLAAFGKPRGYGAGHYSADTSPREIWFYDYMETDGARTDLKFLMVFFETDRYDGHLWFSSSALLDTGE